MEKQVLDDGIVLYTNIIKDVNSMDIIDSLNKIMADNNLSYTGGLINDKKYDENIRSCTAFSLSNRYESMELTREVKKLQFLIDKNINRAVLDYIKSNNVSIKQRENWDIIKYEPGTLFQWHVDDSVYNPRTVSFVLYFNDDYAGGELQFKTQLQGQPFKPPANSLLIFPSNASYMHQVLPITSGIKYSAISFAK